MSIDFIQEIEEDKNSLSEAEMVEYMYDINNQRGFEENLDVFNVEPPSSVYYTLTEKGKEYVNSELIELLDEQQKDFLIKFKRQINGLSLDAILEYVYKNYPEYASESKIKDKYL